MRDAFEACTCEACSSAVTNALMLACKCICDGGTYMCHRHMYMPSAAMVLLACGKRLARTEPGGEKNAPQGMNAGCHMHTNSQGKVDGK